MTFRKEESIHDKVEIGIIPWQIKIHVVVITFAFTF